MKIFIQHYFIMLFGNGTFWDQYRYLIPHANEMLKKQMIKEYKTQDRYRDDYEYYTEKYKKQSVKNQTIWIIFRNSMLSQRQVEQG